MEPAVSDRRPCIYILANGPNGTLYIGVTTNLARRLHEHRDVANGFVSRYGISQLVYVEFYDRIEDAIQRERRLKKWERAWKIRLIEEQNPYWRDMYDDLAGGP